MEYYFLKVLSQLCVYFLGGFSMRISAFMYIALSKKNEEKLLINTSVKFKVLRLGFITSVTLLSS